MLKYPQSVANPKKSVPKHVELREKLRGRFQRLAPNSLIPSARELAKTYKVSAMTVRQALVALQQEGMIHSVPGLGTFVSDRKMSKQLTFVSFTQEVSERGMKPSSKIVVAIKTTVKDQEIADSLNIKVGDSAYKVERVRFADKIPMALEESWVSAELMPGLLDFDLSQSLYDIFKNSFEKAVTRAECVVSPINLSKRQSDLLDTEIKSAALNFIVIAYDSRGRALERCSSIKRGDRFDFKYSIQAQS
jgi:GntR family transcriptional regulator